MSKNIGKTTWLIPDAFWPEKSNGCFPSHEAICVLNTSKTDAQIELTLYFEDKSPMTGFKAKCFGERCNHIRLDKILDEHGRHIPTGVAYAILLESSSNVVVQYSRMDTTQAEMALMTAIAYSVE